MLSFATIVYSKDFPLLRLQALSMARFLDAGDVVSIHVILNDVNEKRLTAQITEFLDAYGPLKSKVHVVSGDAALLAPGTSMKRSVLDRIFIENKFRFPFVRKGGWRGNNGYRMQQALKLGAARVAESEHMVILDTKNIFLRPVSPSDFFTDSGTAKVPFLEVHRDNHRNWLRQSLDALGMTDQGPLPSHTTTFTTPYPVRRSLLLALLKEIDARYRSVQALFASRRRPSEFMLINAFCQKSSAGYAPWFEESQGHALGMWPTYSAQRVKDLISGLDQSDVCCLGLHNRLIALMPPDLLDQLCRCFESRGICDQQTARNILQATIAQSD